MKTITAKELRNNLDQIVARARAGETIRVTYRSKPAFVIMSEPAGTPAPEPGSPEAMQKFIASAEKLRAKAKLASAELPNKTYKEIYYEDMAKKYGVG